MEKRAILAIGLSILVFLGFHYLQQKRLERALPEQPSEKVQSIVPEPEIPPPAEPAPAPAESIAVQPEVPPEDTVASAQTVVIEGDLYKAVIDNRGALLTSWELKDYKSSQEMVFEMISGSHDGEEPSYPGSMIFEDPSLTALANGELYEVSVENEFGDPASLAPPATVVLRLKRGDLAIEKRYSFQEDNYLVDLSLTCERGGKELEGRFLIGEDIGPEHEHFISSTRLEAVYYADGKPQRESGPKEGKEVIEGDMHWVGLDMHYFALIAIPDRSFRSFDIQRHTINSIGIDGEQEERTLLRVTVPMEGELQSQIYIGPKKQSNLKAVESADINGVINHGWFTVLVNPLFASLKWIHQYVHNWGLAIIILTFLLSILLFPFRLKSMISMKKMQAVQPQVKAIQEKYKRYKKTDPKRQEMNQEIMGLYKTQGVNPLGGCLPMILQMPLLFAFYRLLMNAIELRQAPFFWWIQDLSLKDPLYILPIVMGISMFIQQKLTPMTPGADQTQQKMMMFLPLVFTIMFFQFSSGLNLYFLCSNIFQVAFQKTTERWIGDGKSKKPAKSKSKSK
jgi:YidC/Oxa1 family membrane protein insertase